MNKKRISLVLLSVFLLILLAGCPAGPAGPTSGNNVYLQDSDGNVYNSGSSVFLGSVMETSGPTAGIKQTTFTLVNESGTALTLSNFPNPITYSYETLQPKTGNTIYSTAAPTGNIVVNTTSLAGSLAAASESGNIIFTLDANSPPRVNVIIRRRYVIEMTDGTENFDFVFEVYGFIISSAGWGT